MIRTVFLLLAATLLAMPVLSSSDANAQLATACWRVYTSDDGSDKPDPAEPDNYMYAITSVPTLIE
jgi:hypothetical protein